MTKSHLHVAPVESYRIYYKGENGGFPQVRAVVNLMFELPVVCLNTKSVPTMHSPLCAGFVQVRVNE
jgi:hypothetical protein